MKICKGGCGGEAVYGNWCCIKYQNCSGYKKKLSDKAKLRGNNGVRGVLSKKYSKEDLIISEYDLVCCDCGLHFTRSLRGATFKRKKDFRCDDCIKKSVSESITKKHKEKIDLLPYEKKSLRFRKKIKWILQGSKCNRCDFNKYDPLVGPYEIHHIDGNANNKFIDNEELICCNCHSMTDNYRFRGGHHNSISKSEKFGGVYEQRKNWVQS